MKEVLLGFDARRMVVTFDDEWDTSSRETFLLKHNIQMPLSVDEMIWKPLITDDMVFDLPPKYSWVQHLWMDLDKLRDFIKLSKVHYWEIAVTQFFDEETFAQNGIYHVPLNPQSIQPDWTFLGYDVAEEVLLSGLMNMGYKPEIKPQISREFADELNSYHLFKDYEVAKKFAVWNQTRDAGHGPWFVTGLYRIADKNST